MPRDSNEWAIMDSEGVIFRGPEDEIKTHWREPGTWRDAVTGDLLLIEIHGIMK